MVNITRHELRALLAGRAPSAPATAGHNPELDGPEPLFAVYEPSAFPLLRERYEAERYSLRKALIELQAMQVRAFSRKSLINVNTPADFRAYR
jgi:molybdopterin-guanine dinucleotide biosynthesis protein A